LGTIEPTLMVQADVRQPAKVLQQASDLLDPDEPVGLIATALVHFWPDKAESQRILSTYRRAFRAGGYLIFSCACADMDPYLREAMAKEYTRSGASLYPQTRDEIAAFLDGLDMLEPGLVEASTWRPEPNVPPLPIGQAKFLTAVAGFGPFGKQLPTSERHTSQEAA